MPAFQWLPVDDSDVRWTVRVSLPNGDIHDEEVMASDSDDAATYVTETYAELTGEDFDVVAEWVDPAERLRRSA